jgi:hypothetical protein
MKLSIHVELLHFQDSDKFGWRVKGTKRRTDFNLYETKEEAIVPAIEKMIGLYNGNWEVGEMDVVLISKESPYDFRLRNKNGGRVIRKSTPFS